MSSVEVILYRIIIGWCGNNHKIGIRISRLAIKSGYKVQWLFSQILFDIIILDR